MQIDLDNTYRIEYDGLCFQLQKKRIVTGESKGREAKPENIGKLQTTVEGYYGTLSQAIQGYIKRDIGNDEKETFEAVLDVLESYVTRFDAIFDQVTPVIREAYKKAREADIAKNAETT